MFIFRFFRALIVVVFLSSAACSHLMYHPSDVMFFPNPEELNGLREAVEFKSQDGTKLTGWLFKTHQLPRKGTVIQFHGNAENITSHFASMYWMIAEGYDFFTFDYRGYGISEGKPNQKGLNDDALAAIRYVSKRQQLASGAHDLVLYGQSLGGAVLMRAFHDLTADERTQVKAMVIESSFHNYHAISSDVLSRSFITWLFQPLGYVLVSNEYGPDSVISDISPTPLLVMHGDHDPVVPDRFGRKIFELAREPKKLLIVPGARHIACMDADQGKYRPELLQFLDSQTH